MGQYVERFFWRGLEKFALKVQFFIQTFKTEEKIAGFWTQSSTGNKCQVITGYSEVIQVSCSDTIDVNSGAIFIGLCQRNLNDHSIKNAADDPSTSQHNIYTCQCQQGYGYENCTETSVISGQIDFGHTYCVDTNELPGELVTIKSGSDLTPLIYIDHASYGRPLMPPESSITRICRDHYATKKEDVSMLELLKNNRCNNAFYLLIM